MSGLCGWFAGDVARGEDAALIARMARRVTRLPSDVERSHASGAVGVAVVGPPAETDLHAAGQTVAAIIGRPRWKGEYAEIATRDGNAAALAAAFARLGHALFDVLGGPVAIFAADAASGRAMAAIDRFGIQRLCYAARETAPLVFGATTDAVRAFPGVDAALNPQALFDYLYFSKAPAPETIYRAQKKLLAAEYLWHEAGRTTTGLYWRMPFETTDRRPLSALGPELVETVRRAVDRSIQDLDPATVGSFLSGGLDSSTVTGMLSRSPAGPAKAFSIGFEEEGFDERSYARLAARHFGARHYEYVMTPADFAALTPLMATAYDEPFSNTSAILVHCCARLARENGVTTMLAGDGGDEIFGGNSRYVQQRYFDLYANLPAWVRGIMGPAIRAIPFGARLPVVRSARGYVTKATVPLPERLQVFNAYAACGPARIMADDLLPEIEARHPVDLLRLSYDRVTTRSSLQRMLALDIQVTLADDDLRKVCTMCEAAGMAVRYPLLDDEVGEFAAHVPPELLIKGFRLRHFYKEAFRGFLPDETLTKSKHGFGAPFEQWVANEALMGDMVRDSLSSLKRRRLYSDRFIDDITSGKAADVLGFRHDAQWSLMMMELWLRAHVDSSRF